MREFVIRKAVEKDVPLILDFIQRLAEYEKLSNEVVASEEILHKSIFVENKAEVVIAEENNVPVGFALFFHNFSTFVGRKGLYLEDLFVLPEKRGLGYGKALLKHLANLAVERNCGRMEWVCLDWNTSSIDFYKSLGAIPVDGWTIYRLVGDNLDSFAKKID
jgi:GNAT superfamily N-acetyltransferase